MLVGVANIIPGVSGGTMALMLKIYEPLIEGINNISVHTVVSFFKALSFKKVHIESFKEEMRKIHFELLFFILIGAAGAVLLFAGLMTYLLSNFQSQTFGFFFGLIIMSIAVPYKLVNKVNWQVVVAFVIAIVLVVGLSFLESDVEKVDKEEQKITLDMDGANDKADYSLVDYGMLMLSGGVAMSTMIMPGISGSFMLLLMGKYFMVLEAISQRNLVVIAVFGFGAVLGLLMFSRLVNFLLKKHHNTTMGFLTGLVVGSLWELWPFKGQHILSNGELLMLSNQLPATINVQFWVTLLMVLLGMVAVYLMMKLEKE